MTASKPRSARRGRGALRLACLVAALALHAAASQAAPPAAGGVALLKSLERTPLSIVGRVAEPRRIDRQGYVATLSVEHVIADRDERAQAGAELASLRIAWEELAPARPPRFALGDRVFVSLVPLPTSSLWRTRLPDEAERRRTHSVAADGNAFLRNPSPATVDLLTRFAAIDASARRGAAGLAILAGLAAHADTAVAKPAILRVTSGDGIEEPIERETAESLVAALLRPDLDEPSALDLLQWIERARPEALRAPLSRAASNGVPVAVAGLAALDGGLGTEAADRLASDPDPAWRRVAARWARGPDAADLVSRLARRDGDASVRLAAVQRLASGPAEPRAEDALLRALGDPEPRVRRAAIDGLARRAPASVPALRRVAMSGSGEASRSAVAALDAAERAGDPALVEVAERHDDPGMRLLAAMALGRPIGDD